MIKKLKKARPSVIFQLVVVVALFSYRGCSSENDGLDDMSYGDKAASGHLKQLLPQDNAASGRAVSAYNAVAAIPRVQQGSDDTMLKPFVLLPQKEQQATGSTQVSPFIAAAGYLK